MFELENSDWASALAPILHSSSYQRLTQDVAAIEASGQAVYPPANLRFRAMQLSSLGNTRVVILGQDPYHGAGQANGLAFSVDAHQKIPPSLKNIFKELESDLGLTAPEHGDLSAWAEQGVLLLNTVLSVNAGEAASHAKLGWQALSDQIISVVSAKQQPCVFVLWGAYAQKKRVLIAPHHYILESAHPSPLSAYRGFLGSAVFSNINVFLKQQGERPIDWALPESNATMTQAELFS